MSKFARFSAAVIAIVMLASPAMARHVKSWHDKNGAYVEASHVVRMNGHHCIMRAPDVGAFASDPYTKPPCEEAAWY